MSTRDDLVDVALRLLERDGLGPLTLRTIAREAGVSHGAPRRHFSTYAALLAAVARRGADDLDATLAPLLSRATDKAGLRKAARAYVDFAIARPHLFELITRHDLLEGAGGELRGTAGAWFTELRAAMSRARGGPVAPKEALALWGGVHGLAVLFSRRATEAAAAGAGSPSTAVAVLVDRLV